MSSRTGLAALAACCLATAAHAGPIGVDAVLSPGEYGSPSAQVAYAANAPTSNFDTPGPTSTVAYTIYQRSANGYYYALFQARPDLGGTSAGAFVNAYYDLDPAKGNGSDILFSINPNNGQGTAYYLTNEDTNYANLPGLTVAVSADGNTVEFALPVGDFTDLIAGITYDPGQGFPVAGAGSPAADITLRLSQSFSYSVAGGDSFGSDRLGRVTLEAAAQDVPEPLSLTVLAGGAIAMGMARRQRGAGRRALMPAV